MANAFEALGRPDSAAATLERALMSARETWFEQLRNHAYAPYAHRRLALLYARMGRPEDAVAHGEAFLAAMTHPDPELRPWMDEMRRLLATSRGMARPERL
jgi:hypothetical protein